jgi:acyl-CoA thioesterase-2
VSAAAPLESLLRLLALEPAEPDRFTARTGRGEGRLFGGLVAAQAVIAAGRTVGSGALHSLHAHFLRPGRHGAALRLDVERIRDGRTFTTRRIVAVQDGGAVFHAVLGFARPEDGIAHQAPAPQAPPPELCVDWEEHRAEVLGRAASARREQPVEVRVCDPDRADGAPQEPRRRVWVRPRGALPEDPLVHAALLVYASDRTLLGTAARPHGLPWGRRVAASLDHAVWLHRPVRFDDWLLYASESPVAHAARALVLGALYDRAGRRVASVAQEGLIRAPRAPA